MSPISSSSSEGLLVERSVSENQQDTREGTEIDNMKTASPECVSINDGDETGERDRLSVDLVSVCQDASPAVEASRDCTQDDPRDTTFTSHPNCNSGNIHAVSVREQSQHEAIPAIGSQRHTDAVVTGSDANKWVVDGEAPSNNTGTVDVMEMNAVGMTSESELSCTTSSDNDKLIDEEPVEMVELSIDREMSEQYVEQDVNRQDKTGADDEIEMADDNEIVRERQTNGMIETDGKGERATDQHVGNGEDEKVDDLDVEEEVPHIPQMPSLDEPKDEEVEKHSPTSSLSSSCQ